MTHPLEVLSHDEYKTIGRRRTWTLARWWRQLNCWEWPKELLPEENRNVPGTPRRGAIMRRIEEVVAFRTMHEFWKDGDEP